MIFYISHDLFIPFIYQLFHWYLITYVYQLLEITSNAADFFSFHNDNHVIPQQKLYEPDDPITFFNKLFIFCFLS